MHITIIAIGSRGDIQPYIALSQGLIKAGHSVRLVTHLTFADLVRSYHIEFFPLDDQPQSIFQTEEARALFPTNMNPLVFMYRLKHLLDTQIDLYLQQCLEACQNTDVIVVTYLSFFIGYSLAEKMQKTLVVTLLQPTLLPTKRFSEPVGLWLPRWPRFLGALVNYQEHLASGSVVWRLFTPTINRARKTILNLPPLPQKSIFATLPEHVALILFAYSPSLLPKPDDWGATTYVTGFWLLNQNESWQPDPALVDFLAAGSAPIYIGFGSLSDRDPAGLLDISRQVLARTQQRAIVLMEKGYMQEQKLSEQIYVANSIPHDWLFPRMHLIIHHGGAGTTAASLAAGKPSIVVPHTADQQFWGNRVAALGAGPRPLLRRNLSVETLTKTLFSVLKHPEMNQKAWEIGQGMHEEHGVEQAVQAINTHLNREVQDAYLPVTPKS